MSSERSKQSTDEVDPFKLFEFREVGKLRELLIKYMKERLKESKTIKSYRLISTLLGVILIVFMYGILIHYYSIVFGIELPESITNVLTCPKLNMSEVTKNTKSAEFIPFTLTLGSGAVLLSTILLKGVFRNRNDDLEGNFLRSHLMQLYDMVVICTQEFEKEETDKLRGLLADYIDERIKNSKSIQKLRSWTTCLGIVMIIIIFGIFVYLYFNTCSNSNEYFSDRFVLLLLALVSGVVLLSSSLLRGVHRSRRNVLTDDNIPENLKKSYQKIVDSRKAQGNDK